jgi:hypothetical protein
MFIRWLAFSKITHIYFEVQKQCHPFKLESARHVLAMWNMYRKSCLYIFSNILTSKSHIQDKVFLIARMRGFTFVVIMLIFDGLVNANPFAKLLNGQSWANIVQFLKTVRYIFTSELSRSIGLLFVKIFIILWIVTNTAVLFLALIKFTRI